MASAEIRALESDLDLLRAEGGDSASTTEERAAAVRSRQERIAQLRAGATPRAMQAPRALSPARVNITQEQIRDMFDFYANFGRTQVMTFQDSLDSFMFMKFVKECPGLLDDAVNRTEVDLIFTKAKPKFERRLDFEHFLDALAAIAERKFPDYTPADGLRLLITNHLAPQWELYQRECQKTGETEVPLSGVYKKLYDVRSYTGVYAERFRSADGRINGEADNRPGRVFTGSTNLGTDETIHDISVLMRPNLRSGSMMTTQHTSAGASCGRAGGGGHYVRVTQPTPQISPTIPPPHAPAPHPFAGGSPLKRSASVARSVSPSRGRGAPFASPGYGEARSHAASSVRSRPL